MGIPRLVCSRCLHPEQEHRDRQGNLPLVQVLSLRVWVHDGKVGKGCSGPSSPVGDYPGALVGSEMPCASLFPCHGQLCAASPGGEPGTRDPGAEMTLLSTCSSVKGAETTQTTAGSHCETHLHALLRLQSLEEVTFVAAPAYPAASHLCPELLVLRCHGSPKCTVP